MSKIETEDRQMVLRGQGQKAGLREKAHRSSPAVRGQFWILMWDENARAKQGGVEKRWEISKACPGQRGSVGGASTRKVEGHHWIPGQGTCLGGRFGP